MGALDGTIEVGLATMWFLLLSAFDKVSGAAILIPVGLDEILGNSRFRQQKTLR